MSRAGDLIPNKLPWEAAAAAGLSDALPVNLVAMSVNPAIAPARFLPWLAAGRGARLWFNDWSLARKRQMASEAPELAALVGTRAGIERMLAFVDAELLDVIAYPTRFVMGRAVVSRTPIGHGAHLARYLIRVRTFAPRNALILGRTLIGRRALRTPSTRAFDRVHAALRAAKAPECEIRLTFQHMRPLSADDGVAVDQNPRVGQWLARATQ